MTKQVTLENVREGGIGLTTGHVIPGKGSISVEPEIWDASKDHPVIAALVKDGVIFVDGKGKKKPAEGEDRDENGDTAEMAALRKQFGDAAAAAQTELATANGRIADLEKTLAERDTEITTLKAGGGASAQKKG